MDIGDALAAAWRLLVTGDRELFDIVLLSLQVSLFAVVCAALVGLPLGAVAALFPFPGRVTLTVVMNAAMGLPPVVAGLFVYLLLSRSGPLGPLDLLFTPTAMVIAQWLLITPIIAALTRQAIEDLYAEYREHLRSLGVGGTRLIGTMLWDARVSLVTAVVAGFGRASAEVGAVMIVGGNIRNLTRTMTTAIALETSKGDFALALGLGLILMTLALGVNAAAYLLREQARRYAV